MIIAVNGSPRKNKNTVTLLEKALEGARLAGAETEMVHLYDYLFKGCVSCFSCKRKNGRHGVCALQDELAPLLERIKSADGLILGSPIYYWNVTGLMRSFLERLLFSNMLYSRNNRWVFPKKMPSAFIYTWGADEGRAVERLSALEPVEISLEGMLGQAPLILHSFNSWQFDDYSRYETDAVNVEEKKHQRETVFPEDCRKALELGQKLALAV